MSYDGLDRISYDKHEGRADTDEALDLQIDGIDPKASWFVGHVRHFTHGSPADNRNNHPIPHGNIIGVHNGVLRNHAQILSVTGREDDETQVDSEAIFAAVNRWGPTKGLRRIKGDMVAVYADERRPHVLHVARTEGRYLSIGWTERGNIIFASERQALKALEPEVVFTKFSSISENRLLVLRHGKIIQRHQFHPPRPLDDFQITHLRELNRASKRGEILFPSTRNIPAMVPTEIVTATGGPPPDTSSEGKTLFYFNGVLLTHSEYLDTIKSDGTY